MSGAGASMASGARAFWRFCGELSREAVRGVRRRRWAFAAGLLLAIGLTVFAFDRDPAVNEGVRRARERWPGANRIAHYYRLWGRGHDTAAFCSLLLIWAALRGRNPRARPALLAGLAAAGCGIALGARFDTWNAGTPAAVLGILLLASAALRGDRRWARCALAALLAALSAGLVVNAVRFSTGRPRPRASDVQRLQGPTLEADHQSFPSGHAATSSGAAACLLVCAPPLGALAVINAAGIGWSSVHSRAHHLSDVVAGTGVGLLIGLAFGGAVRRLNRVRSPTPAPPRPLFANKIGAGDVHWPEAAARPGAGGGRKETNT